MLALGFSKVARGDLLVLVLQMAFPQVREAGVSAWEIARDCQVAAQVLPSVHACAHSLEGRSVVWWRR